MTKDRSLADLETDWCACFEFHRQHLLADTSSTSTAAVLLRSATSSTNATSYCTELKKDRLALAATSTEAAEVSSSSIGAARKAHPPSTRD